MALLHQIKITSSFFIFFICHFFPLPLSPFFILAKFFPPGQFVWVHSCLRHLSIISVGGHRELSGLCSDGVPSGRSSRITKVGPPLGASLFWKPLPNYYMSSPLDPLHLIWAWMHVDGCDVLRCLCKDEAMILCWIYFLYINYGRRRWNIGIVYDLS